MTKPSAKAMKTRAALTVAFWELYKDKPISKITVKDITDRAGYYRSTFYLYFTDVYNVLEQIEGDILRDWETMISEVLEQGKTDILLEVTTEFYEKYGEYLSILLSPEGDPTFLQTIKDMLRPKMISVYKVSVDDARVGLIFEYFISAVLAFLTGWYRGGRRIPAQEAVTLIHSLVSEGIPAVLFRDATKSPS